MGVSAVGGVKRQSRACSTVDLHHLKMRWTCSCHAVKRHTKGVVNTNYRLMQNCRTDA